MKKWMLILLAITFFSCLKKLYKEQFDNGDIKVNWYYYSDITNSSMDFVEVEKNDSIVLVAKVLPGLYNLEVKSDSIIMDLAHPDLVSDGEIRSKGKVFGYHIIYRQVDSYEEYIKQNN